MSSPTDFPIKNHATRRRLFSAAGLAGLVAATALAAPRAAAAPAADKVLGPASCAECHPQEIEIWKKTLHFKSLYQAHRTPEAAKIVAQLGLQPMKSEPLCAQCHYLARETDGASEIAAAVSCESCHGAAKGWVEVHGDYGRGFKVDTEPAAHRVERRAAAVAQGMTGPDDVYGLGRSCYGCHVVTDEKLANVGGHTPGSPGFNLLAWTQGEVRHNVLRNGGQANPEAPLPVRRRLLAVGWILEAEYSLRATARATEKATYGVTYARRADAARKMLEKIQALAPTPELEAILAVVRPVGLKLNNGAELNAAADKLGALGRAFADHVTGEQLAGLDSLLPAADTYKGTPFAVTATP
jgi:hypothetical protein